MTTNEREIEFTKLPPFDGKRDNYPIFKSKMKSYLAKNNLVELIWSNEFIQPASHVWSTDVKES